MDHLSPEVQAALEQQRYERLMDRIAEANQAGLDTHDAARYAELMQLEDIEQIKDGEREQLRLLMERMRTNASD